MVIHDRTHAQGAKRSAIAHRALDDLTEGQHAGQLTTVHDDQRAEVLVGHELHGLHQRLVGVDGVEGVAFDAQDVADVHERSLQVTGV